MTEPLRRDIKKSASADLLLLQTKFKNKMVASITETANTKGGLNLLRYLFHESGFVRRSAFPTKDGMNTEAMLWNESRRDFYLDIRQFMTPEVVKQVELANEEENRNARPEPESKSKPQSRPEPEPGTFA